MQMLGYKGKEKYMHITIQIEANDQTTFSIKMVPKGLSVKKGFSVFHIICWPADTAEEVWGNELWEAFEFKLPSRTKMANLTKKYLDSALAEHDTRNGTIRLAIKSKTKVEERNIFLAAVVNTIQIQSAYNSKMAGRGNTRPASF